MSKNRLPAPLRKIPLPILILLVVLVGVVGYRYLVVAEPAVAGHPTPRDDVSAETVVPAERYAGYPRIAGTYRNAAEIPGVLDGLYCHCDCSEHSGHRSLLTCFESDHAARCDVCLGEAELAFRMTGEDASLDEIRQAVDASFGR